MSDRDLMQSQLRIVSYHRSIMNTSFLGIGKECGVEIEGLKERVGR